MWQEWIWTDWTSAGMAAFSTLVVYAGVIVYARIFGLRSLSKMSSFDFAMTIALGSLFASTVSSPSPSLVLGLFTLGVLFSGQKLIAVARQSHRIKQVVDNSPVLLMLEGEVLHNNLRRTQVTMDDLRAKLRQANVLRYEDVRAVIFETTGDVSVLHGNPQTPLSAEVLQNVRGVARE